MNKFKWITMLCIVVLLVVPVSGAIKWTWETGTNPDLLNQFMLNPQFGTITLWNGLTIDNATNNALEFNENSEELILTFADTAVTWSTETGIVTMGFGVIVPTANQFLFTPRADPVGTTEGTVYADTDHKLYYRNGTSWVDLTATTTSTMDDIYNNSAAALGVTVDVNPIIWTAPNANDKVVMSFVQADTGTTKAITITNAGTGNTIDIEGQATGKDIEGTGDTWNVAGTGAATFVSGAIPSLTATTITLSNGGTISNATDTEIKFTETATALEDFSIDFLADEIDFKSGSGVATIGWGDLDSWTGLNVLTFDASASTITLLATGASQDLTISVTGTQDASLVLSSAGTAADALQITTTGGGIDITNASGTAGEDIDITSAASVNITASEAAADAIVISAGTAVGGIDITSNADIDMTTTGAADEDISLINTGGSIWIEATEAAADAVTIKATTALGGIDITSNADIDITTTGAADEDITITNTGGSVIVSSTEDIADAIFINATTGGIDITADGASAKDLDLVCTNGSINLTAGESAVDSIVISSSLGGIDITAAAAAAGEDIDISAAGSSVNLSSTENAALAIYLLTNGGTSETINLTNTLGTNAAAIALNALAGGITLSPSGAIANQFYVNAAGTVAGNAINLATTDGGISLTAGGADNGDISLASTDNLTLNGGSAGSLINIGTNTQGNVFHIGDDDTTADAITIGSAKDTSALAGILVTLGSTGTTSAVAIQSGSGGVNINRTNNQPVSIGDGTCTGTVTLGGDGVQAIVIGNGAAAKTVTLGSSNTTSTTNILAGSGGINITGSVVRTSQQYVQTISYCKVGTTAGWVVPAAADAAHVAALPASQTASTLVIPITTPLKVGWTITAWTINGQIDSGGNTATLDAILYKHTEATGGFANTAIGSGMTQLSKTGDYKVVEGESSLGEVVAADESFYLLVTGTTAAETDEEIASITVTVSEI